MSNIADKINEAIDAILEAAGDEERRRAAIEAKSMVEAEIDDLEAQAGEDDDDDENVDVIEAVNKFLDEVERPVGTQKFKVPESPAVNRALLRLHDAVSRGL
ncbi:MAG: hypothetical protein Q8M26_08825 [Pseudolabrys sp.]|nr:hypothetical protein [Pseudolabrys sp.]